MRLLENGQIVAGVVPVDLNAAAVTGFWCSLQNYRRATVVFFAGAGTLGSDVSLTVQQATDTAAGGAKNLATVTEYWFKQGAAIESIGQWTRVTQSASHQILNTDSGENELVYVFEILDTDLDIDNGFIAFNVSTSDPGAAKVGAVLYLLSEPRYGTRADQMPSAV